MLVQNMRLQARTEKHYNESMKLWKLQCEEMTQDNLRLLEKTKADYGKECVISPLP